MAYITGTSNYPSDFDLNPSGSGTNSTLLYVLDEIRDSNGVVTQSGNKVVAYDVNVAYTVLDQIERVLGTDPAGNFNDVAERLQFLTTGTSFGASAFVHITGDTVTGPLTIESGATLNITDVVSSGLNWVMSGNSTISSNGSVTESVFARNISSFSYQIGGFSVGISSYAVGITGLYANLEGSGLLRLASQGYILVSGNFVPELDNVFDIGTTGVYYSTIYANSVISSGTGISSLNGLVSTSGSTMSGNLTFGSGASILNSVSGINQIGDDTNPFGDIYTKTLHATNITGMSPITVLSDLEFSSGISIGSLSNPVDTIYANNLVGVSGLDLNAIVAKSGSDIFGDLTFSGNASIVLESGSNISTSVSGVGNIGASGTPFANLYVKTINDRTPTNFIFNESLTGTTDGVNKHFYFANAPTSAMIFVSGILILPATQYVISGTSLFLTGSMYAPTTAPVAGFYIY
jgi:hypothetical protein